jgi:hypothetical protein
MDESSKQCDQIHCTELPIRSQANCIDQLEQKDDLHLKPKTAIPIEKIQIGRITCQKLVIPFSRLFLRNLPCDHESLLTDDESPWMEILRKRL